MIGCRLPWPVSGSPEDNRVEWELLRTADHIVHAHPLGLGHDLSGLVCWCGPWLEQACPACMGRGDEVRSACPHCGGRGVVEHTLADLDSDRDVLVCHRDVSIAALN